MPMDVLRSRMAAYMRTDIARGGKDEGGWILTGWRVGCGEWWEIESLVGI